MTQMKHKLKFKTIIPIGVIKIKLNKLKINK